MNSSRRNFLRLLASLPACMPVGKVFAELADEAVRVGGGNFRYVYGNEAYRDEFYNFLVNVFHLYPQDEVHERIRAETENRSSDRATYLSVQSQLGDVKENATGKDPFSQ